MDSNEGWNQPPYLTHQASNPESSTERAKIPAFRFLKNEREVVGSNLTGGLHFLTAKAKHTGRGCGVYSPATPRKQEAVDWNPAVV